MSAQNGRRRFGRVAGLALLLLAAGCNDSDTPSTQNAIESPTTAATAVPTKPDPVADEARVRAVLLKTGDLPASWVASGAVHPSADDDRAVKEMLANCFALNLVEMNPVVDLDSATFTLGDAQVDSNVFTLGTQAITDQYQAALVKDGPRCLGQAFAAALKKGMPPDLAIGAPDIQRVGTAVSGQDSKYTVSITVTRPATGEQFRLTGGLTSVHVGRLVIETSLVNTGSDIPLTALDAATAAQYHRATAAG